MYQFCACAPNLGVFVAMNMDLLRLLPVCVFVRDVCDCFMHGISAKCVDERHPFRVVDVCVWIVVGVAMSEFVDCVSDVDGVVSWFCDWHVALFMLLCVVSPCPVSVFNVIVDGVFI